MALNQKPLAQILKTPAYSLLNCQFLQISSSIKKIKQVVNGSDVSDSEGCSFKTINASEIKAHLKNLGIKNASESDTIPPKLVKLSANFLTPLLTKSHQHEYFTKYFSRKR